MDIVNACAERESLGGGRYQSVLHVKPIAYLDGGSYYRSNHDFVNGDATYPHVVDAAPFKMRVKADGARRIFPTREDDRYIEFGPPNTWQVNRWRAVNLGTVSRLANKLTWKTSGVDYLVTHCGHYTKLDIPFKAGYLPPTGRIAFPLVLNGLTLSGRTILREGVAVGTLREPYVYDAAVTGPMQEHRPIALSFLTDSGVTYAVYTLPDTTGMTSPVADPTLELQPDAAAGQDDCLISACPTWNCGTRGGGWIQANRPILMRFSLSSIASGASCTSAVLTLTLAWAPIDKTASIHHIAAANGDWIEGTKSEAVAGAGEPCWNAKEADGSGGVTTAWAGSAGLSTPGTDYTASAMGTFTLLSTDTYDVTTYTPSLDTATVASWFGSVSNNGMIIFGSDNAGDPSISFSDRTTAAYRPKLTVEYTTGSKATRRSLLGVGW